DRIRDYIVRAVSALKAPDGVVGILGNHDTGAIAATLEANGVRLLLNETVALRRGGETIYLTGTDDVHHFWSPAALRTLESAPRDQPRIALVPSPELAGEAAALGYALYLCGHTHGGQFCLPGGIPIVTMGAMRSTASGAWRRGAMLGYTSRGIGTSTMPLRFN